MPCPLWTLFDTLSDYASKKGPMDILVKTVRKEGILALYKGPPLFPPISIMNPPLPLSPLNNISQA